MESFKPRQNCFVTELVVLVLFAIITAKPTNHKKIGVILRFVLYVITHKDKSREDALLTLYDGFYQIVASTSIH